MPSKQWTFRELVEEKYLREQGFNKIRAFAKIYTESGVSIGSLRAAFNGTNVLPETVEDLVTWAFQMHRAELDQLALLKAPPKVSREPSVLERVQLVEVRLVASSDAGENLFHITAVATDNDVTPDDIRAALEAHMRSKEAG